eukprot:TRINITY_DN3216_c1_g1_i1.p1 TRINITY_DN3216_c1_g1~~TRINITY_DN3216_c1_g1_i1.p1  ORF type:complete len:779 (+),score=123.07 TRINITY_DN3216_c1_g1_i1:49-2385(+)
MSREKQQSAAPLPLGYCNVGGSLNALSANPEKTLVAVAGRDVLKLLEINGNELKVKTNLRTGQNANTSTSCNDVKWNPVEAFKTHIVTSATSGTLMLWNLTPQAPRSEKVATEHRRAVNRVCWHPSDGNLFLSGSQDGSVKLWDIRNPKQSAATFDCRADSVRDVQFNPHIHTMFATGTENSNLQIWDLRKNSAPEKQLNACQAPILTIDWHSEDPYVIASGGRDNSIKIWNLINVTKPTHTVQTVASVCQIKWRPNSRTQIASSALLLDFSIHTWDITRPYIPRFSVTDMNDVTTGFIWFAGEDEGRILSCSKDGVVAFHQLSSVYRPFEHIRASCLSWSPNSELVSITERIDRVAQSSVKLPSSVMSPPSAYIPPFSSPPIDHASRGARVFANVLASVPCEDGTSLAFDRAAFQYLAENYKYDGMSVSELCQYNAHIANNANLHQIEHMWRMIDVLYADYGFTKVVQVENEELNEIHDIIPYIGDTPVHNDGPAGEAHNTSLIEPNSTVYPALHQNDLDLDADDLFDQKRLALNPIMDEEGLGEDLNVVSTLDDLIPLDLPNALVSDSVVDNSFEGMFPISPENSRPHSPSLASLDDGHRPNRAKWQSNLPSFDQEPVITELFDYLLDQGDVQNCVAISLVLGPLVTIEEKRMELWQLEYIELLQRLQLWTIAGDMIRKSKLQTVQALSMTSTTIHTSCAYCQKPLLKSGWFCDRCALLMNTCSICHQLPRGLYSWCQGCGHGGHASHLQEWFARYAVCPAAGCGHLCGIQSTKEV